MMAIFIVVDIPTLLSISFPLKLFFRPTQSGALSVSILLFYLPGANNITFTVFFYLLRICNTSALQLLYLGTS